MTHLRRPTAAVIVASRRPTAAAIAPGLLPRAAIAIARRLPAAAIVAVLFALVPSSASAALDVRRVGTALTVTGSTSGDTQIEIDADQSVFVAGSEVAVNTSTPATCTAKSGYVECGDADLTSLSVTLTGSGDDTVEIKSAPFAEAATLTVSTGPGDDELLFYGGEQRVIATLGSGNDRTTTDEGADELHGGPGNDEFAPGAGDDQVWGDDGNDRFIAETTADGDDTFDGGSDVQAVGTGGPASLSGPAGAGDTVDYGARKASVTVRLPADDRTVPEGDNGAPTEHDRIAHVESATGAGTTRGDAAAASALTGNERPNALIGGLGPDTLSGAGGSDLLRGGLADDRYDAGDGDDLIDARTGTGAPSTAGDLDRELTCGPGNDGLRRDPADPEGNGCEHLAPILLTAPQIEGNPRVGNALTVGRASVAGEVTAASTSWFTCPGPVSPKPGQSIDDPALGCRAFGTTTTFVPTDRELGRTVYAVSSLLWSFGDEPGGLTAPLGPLTEALPTDPVMIQKPEAETGPGGDAGKPGEPFAQVAKRLAFARLGSGAVASNLSLGSGTAVYETAASLGGKFPVTPTSTRLIAAVVCERACSLTVEGRVTLTPSNRKKRPKVVKLRRQSFAVAAGSAATVPFNASASQRTKLGGAKKAKLTLTFALRAADGTTRRATKRYIVKVHAPGTPR